MSLLLFSLQGVPDEEADEVRDLLQRHNLAFYETSAGRWGVGTAALWLVDESQLSSARGLLDEYQRRRRQQTRLAHAQAQRQGLAPTALRWALQNPARSLAAIVAIAAILYLSIWPFIRLGH